MRRGAGLGGAQPVAASPSSLPRRAGPQCALVRRCTDPLRPCVALPFRACWAVASPFRPWGGGAVLALAGGSATFFQSGRGGCPDRAGYFWFADADTMPPTVEGGSSSTLQGGRWAHAHRGWRSSAWASCRGLRERGYYRALRSWAAGGHGSITAAGSALAYRHRF